MSNIKNLVNSINKSFGEGSFMKLGEQPKITIGLTSSGSLKLDKALGGGFGEGRIVEIYGKESSGKTTLALLAAAEHQKKGGRVAFIDVEHALDTAYAELLGINVDELFLSQPDSGEDALEIVDRVAESGEFSLVVIDSVAALVPKAELEGNMGDAQMGKQARLMSQACRKLTGKASKNKCDLIFINQTRMKIGVMFGNPETTAGGNALKFYATQRLEVNRSTQIKEGDEAIGHIMRIKIVKNKIAPPFKVTNLNLYYGIGLSIEDELTDLCVEEGIIDKKGSWYSYGETKIGQGSTAVRQMLLDNPELVDELKLKLKEKLESNSNG